MYIEDNRELIINYGDPKLNFYQKNLCLFQNPCKYHVRKGFLIVNLNKILRNLANVRCMVFFYMIKPKSKKRRK
jgi:hypothetical protein